MATTPCPFCGAAVHVPKGETGPCPACGQALRFIDAPTAPCTRCGKVITYLSGQEAARCRCGHWQAMDAEREVRFEATCPRCRRQVEVGPNGKDHTCPHCRTTMMLQDTF